MINVQCQQNLNLFTEEENEFLFQSHIAPEYEIVEVSHKIQKRSLDKFYGHIFLKTFNKSLTLYLEPRDSALIGDKTKIWSMQPDKWSRQGVKYNIISSFSNVNFQTLHDVSNQAALTVEEDKYGNLGMYGNIDNNLIIQPLPESYQKKYNSKIRHIRDTSTNQQYKGINNNFLKYQNYQNNDQKNTIPHVIHKLPPVNHRIAPWPVWKPKFNDVFYKEPKQNYGKNKSENSKMKTVYPEILLFVDNSLFNKLGRDVDAVKKYVATYWNAVDLRFRQLTNPMVRLNIAEIIISTGKVEVPFLGNSGLKGNALDADKILIDIGKHLYLNRIFNFPGDYDLSMTMTSRDMCNKDYVSYSCDTLGYANVAAACTTIEDEKLVEAVGVVEDNGGLKGIIPTAHELAHILGASHDDVNDSECEYKAGYIMEGAISFHDNSFDWSPCSMEDFNFFLSHSNSTCLKNKPIIGMKKTNLLPGLHYSLEYQCEQHVPGTKPCDTEEHLQNICKALKCSLGGMYSYCERVASAAEGSRCGKNSICLNGKCIKASRKLLRYY